MNIVLLTQIFPTDDQREDSTFTKIAYYFAKSWIEEGHNVVVFHCPNVLWKPVYYLPNSVKAKIKGKMGVEIASSRITKREEYKYHNVQVVREPFFKVIPRHMASAKEIKRGTNDIINTLHDMKFKPDIFIAHFASPCLPILAYLKHRYPKIRTSLVIHEEHYFMGDKYGTNKLFKYVDAIGTRSKTLSEKLQKELNLNSTPYVCYSGVADEYIKESVPMPEKAEEPITRFIYTGLLIKRKHAETIIEALSKSEFTNWHLDIVGNGDEEGNLKQLAKSLGVEKSVTFHGRIPRDEVQEIMGKAQCFIMVSEGEAFGLVYLEAMLASCITIASKGEGIDGVINDGENGYLCNSGDADDLCEKLKKINKLSVEERRKIVDNAYKTACEFSDKNKANRYLNDAQTWKG